MDQYSFIQYDKLNHFNYARLRRLTRAGHLKFLVQSETQKVLLHKHFGSCEVQIVGLTVLRQNPVDRDGVITDENGPYDVVFHGNAGWAKGAGVALRLAHHLPTYSFFCPGSKEQLEAISDIAGLDSIPCNIKIQDLTWETGLKDLVQGAKVVLNPSLWSAPIEGAFLKSLIQNGCVAIVNEETAYAGTLRTDLVCRLPLPDFTSAANELKNLLLNRNQRDYMRNVAREWCEDFCLNESMFADLVFEAIRKVDD